MNAVLGLRSGRRSLCGLALGLALTCFAAQAVAAAPPRAYELVSPQDKNGADLDRDTLIQDWATTGAAESGGAVAYPAQAAFADAISGAPYGQYISTRTSAGWVTHSVNPRYESEVLNPGQLQVPRVTYLGPDLTKALAFTNARMTDEAFKLGGSWGLYLWDADSPTWRLVSDPWTDLGPDLVSNGVYGRFEVMGASDDMRHVVFISNGRQLTPDGPPGSDLITSGSAVYKWSNGQVEFVSSLPNGDPIGNAVGGAGTQSGGQFHPGDHLVSNDGRRVYFTDISGVGLYVREDGAATTPVSASEREGDDPTVARSGEFWAAEPDTGSRALFTSSERLTSDATAQPFIECNSTLPVFFCRDDLYLWDASAPSGSRLRDLTTGDPAGGGVAGVIASSRDLDHVYFVASGVLDDGAVSGQPNLYEWSEAGGTHLIATLTEADNAVWARIRTSPTAEVGLYRDARTTADGSRLVFTSTAQLTSYDNSGHRQVYLFDSASKQLQCVSCNPSRPASTGDAGLFPARRVLAKYPLTPYRLTRNLSADGSAVVFESDEPLSSSDVNGQADVYEWRQGELSLVSSGKGNQGAQFVDASADGRDVFFITRERLVGSDLDNQSDMYDARIGGGFPAVQPPVACEGDSCQGPLPNAHTFSPPVTSGFAGDGNVRPSTSKKAGKRKAKKCPRGFARKKVRSKPRCVKKVKRASKRGVRR